MPAAAVARVRVTYLSKRKFKIARKFRLFFRGALNAFMEPAQQSGGNQESDGAQDSRRTQDSLRTQANQESGSSTSNLACCGDPSEVGLWFT